MSERIVREDAAGTRRAPAPKPRRRWPVVLAGIFIGLLLLLWFAPAIMVATSLHQQFLRGALGDFPGEVKIGRASLGWFSPVLLGDVEVADAGGEPLLTCRQLSSEKTLVGLIADASELGRFRLDSPVLYVSTREDGSNLEDALQPLLQAEGESQPLGFVLEVVAGEVLLKDSASGQKASLSQLALELVKPIHAESPLTAKLKCVVAGQAQSGQLQANLQWNAPADPAADAFGSGSLNVQSQSVPLEPLTIVLRRLAAGVDVSGALTSDLKCQWTGGPDWPDVDSQGNWTVHHLAVAAPAWLGKDTLQARHVTYAGEAGISQGQAYVKQCRLDSDLGAVTLVGSAPLEKLAAGSWHKILDGLSNENIAATGRVDLARLAAVLPATLRIREGTRITSGTLSAELGSGEQDGHHTWTGRVESTDLTAISGGREIAWEQPIIIQLAAYQTPQGPVIRQLGCQANFMRCEGSGTLEKASFSAYADLSRLAEELDQFIELSDVKLAGQVRAEVEIQRGENRQLALTGNALVENFTLAAPGLRPWSEKRLTLNLDGGGRIDEQDQINLDKATLSVNSGGDSLTVKLREPAVLTGYNTRWPADVQLEGELNSWAARLQPLVPLEGWRLQGGVKVEGQLYASPQMVEIAHANVSLDNTMIAGHGYHVREQLGRLTAVGTWKQSQQRLDAKVATVATTSWSVRGDDVVVQLIENGPPQISGEFAWRSDLMRMITTFRNPGAPVGHQLRGMAEGNVKLLHADGVTQADWTAQVANLNYSLPPLPSGDPQARAVSVSRAPRTVWTERQLKLAGKASYDHKQDALDCQKLEVTGSGASLALAGRIHKLTTDPEADVDGETNYNLAVLSQRLQPYWGRDIQMRGEKTSKFAVKGPLLPPKDAGNSSAALGENRTGQGGRQASPARFQLADRRRESPPQGGRWAENSSPLRDPDRSTPLVSERLYGDASFGWKSAYAYGMNIGQADVSAELRRGVLEIRPLNIEVSKGRLKAAPRIDLRHSQATLTMDRGPLLENVQLTPDMCRSWLKYVAPLLADATHCEGTLSATIHKAYIPLAAPETMQVDGLLTLHGAQVQPGPLARKYLFLAEQLESIIAGRVPPVQYSGNLRLFTLKEQDVEVEMAEGRVYHRGLTLQAGDVSIITSGYVGMDQSLDLVAEIPIKDEWIHKQRILTALSGKVVQIPIKGTLANPHLDRRPIEALTQQLIRGATTRVLSNEVNRLLDGLVKPQNPPPQPPPTSNGERGPSGP